MGGTTLRPRPFAMPPSSPAYPLGPYRFVNREYFIIRYRTDPPDAAAGGAREIAEPVVNYEFIRMAGVYEGLHEAGIRPTRLAGISISASPR
jgi:acetoacetate decarboxylase